jgi:hypothetical protein
MDTTGTTIISNSRKSYISIKETTYSTHTNHNITVPPQLFMTPQKFV